MFDKVGAEDVRVPGVAALGVERADVLVYTTQRTCEQRGDRGLGLCHGGFRLRRECPRPRVVCLQRSVAHGARGNVVEILCQQGLVAANNLCKRQGLLRSRLRHAVGHPRHGAAHGGACHGDVDVTRGQEAGFHGCCQCWLNKSEEKQAPQHTFFHGRELQRHLSAQVVQHPAHYVRDLAGLVGEGAVEVLQQQRQGALVLPHFLRGGPRSDNIHPRLGGDGAERIAENVVKKSPRRVFQQHRQNANGARVGTEQEGGVGRVPAAPPDGQDTHQESSISRPQHRQHTTCMHATTSHMPYTQ
eukprot:m.1517416 g.1517416  ORF g.1517416 m.1517416 type:complete len:301 (+) comp25218_c1_seq44:2298-3200(+)